VNHPTKDTAILAEHLTRSFGSLSAVEDLSLCVNRGEIYGLVGPDGAGKTTTLRMLAGLLDPTGGRARVAGCDLPEQGAEVKTHLAYMSQRFGLYPDLTVDENINFYADLYGMSRQARSARLDELLDFSNMRPFRKRQAGKLSGGMKQKLQLICALIHTPEVLLLDEPTNGVDPVSRRDFWRILYRMLKGGVAILVTTAYLDEAERCNRIGLMDRGRILVQDSPEQVRLSMPMTILAVHCEQSRQACRRHLRRQHPHRLPGSGSNHPSGEYPVGKRKYPDSGDSPDSPQSRGCLCQQDLSAADRRPRSTVGREQLPPTRFRTDA
jgi:ABC-2 type transport system ATP-binding protein